MTEIRELRPARPDADADSSAYMPKLPWRWIVGLGLFFALSYGTYQVREQRETERLRTALIKARGSELAPLIARYETLTKQIYELTQGATRRNAAERYVDPRLNLDALHKGKGLYLRIKASAATTPEHIRDASLDMLPDAIGKCLGLLPSSAGELFARGSFLEKRWFEQVEGADKMKLRVVAEEMRQRASRDLPFVTEALSSQWFMLVLERGENRRDAPVDAFIWDLRTSKLLLSAQVEAEGALVAARIVVAGVKPGNYATGAQTAAAQDCSIASQIRAVAGAGGASFESEPPAPRSAMDPASGATAPQPTAPVTPAPATTPTSAGAPAH